MTIDLKTGLILFVLIALAAFAGNWLTSKHMERTASVAQ